MAKVWAHLHLPRWQAHLDGRGSNRVISVKTPGVKGIKYYSKITIREPLFFVSASGRERTLRTDQRNVHAWVVGERINIRTPENLYNWNRAVYDPWKAGTFVDSKTLAPVESAKIAYLVGKDVYYV